MNHLTKRIVVAVIAFALCVSVAVVSTAVPNLLSSRATVDRVVTVNTDDVLNENFRGYGDNHWIGGEYIHGMNDSYLKVDESRIYRIKPAFMRMMMHQAALVDLTKSAEEQEAAWNAGNWNTTNEYYKRYMEWFTIMAKAGTIIQLNYSFLSDPDYNLEWFGIEDANKNSPPKNLEQYAKSCVFIIKQLLDITEQHGIEGRNKINGKPIVYLSFCNEVNTPREDSFPAFGDRRKYWCEMLERVHNELKAEGIRDQVYMYGTDLTIVWSQSTAYLEEDFLEYVGEKLVDENGNPIYDGLATHPYAKGETYEGLLNKITKLKNINPLVDIAATESMAGSIPGHSMEHRIWAFGFGDFAQMMAIVNAGWSAYGSFNFIGGSMPDYSPADFGGLHSAWDFPSKGLDQVGPGFLAETLGMTYVPAFSKTVKTYNTLADKSTNAEDLLSCAFIKDMDNSDVTDDQITVVIDSDKNSGNKQRNIAVNIGSKYAGMKVERHVLRYKPQNEDFSVSNEDYRDYTYITYDEKSYYWNKNADGSYSEDQTNELTVGGNNAIVAPTDKVITVDENGNINDILPDEHVYILYTTIPEITQIQFKETELEVAVGDSVQFEVDKIYANGGNNGVTYSIMGKTTADAIENNNGVGWTEQDCGSIDQNGVYTADNGVVAGDCVAIKAVPQADPNAYSVMIVNIK